MKRRKPRFPGKGMAGISAVLLAAGESTRMRQPKPLLPWQGKTLLEYQVQALIDAGASEVVVVLGHRAVDVLHYVRGPGVSSVINDQYRQGKTTSIKAGLRSIQRQADGVLLLAVDQPRTPAILERVLHEHTESGALITAPRYQGHGGHPLLFSISLKPELEAISEERMGIREVMERHEAEIHWVEFDTPLVSLDINTPEDFDRAMRLFG